ncbi:MAG TPA: PQQ-dependent sugar dehydrogenase, partial [Frankiaceae bacterium]|nr:PQQ-dependent sugar dehydrogenase [Frankiaceae bacterium]
MWGALRARALLLCAALVVPALATVGAVGTPSVRAATPAGFQDDAVVTGLTQPTSVRFAPDGWAFVAEKGGLIKVFDGLADPTPTVFADLTTNVDNFWDRGLLGLALDPGFSSGQPYVYALYTYDAPIGGTAPTWGDTCPTPPGATTDGCVVSGRLSRLTADATGNVMVAGSEQVFLNDWCQQFPSHSIGALA